MAQTCSIRSLLRRRLGSAVAVGPTLVAALLMVAASGVPSHAQAVFQRGDSNGDGNVDLSDGIKTLSALFLGDVLECRDAADVDDTGTLDITDGVYTFAALFLGGPPPRPPFPECGVDPTDDSLGCDAHAPCPQDAIPPIISGLAVGEITQNSATVTWSTDEAASSLAEFGLDDTYGRTVFNNTLKTFHSLSLSELIPGSTYHLRISSGDASGNVATTADQTFATAPASTELRQAGHLLNRIAYGPTPSELERVLNIGIRAYTEEQLDPASIDESGNVALRSREDALFEERQPTRDTRIVSAGEIWEYRRGTSEPPATWTELDFDANTDSGSWLAGPTGIGYSDGDDNTVLADMRRLADDPDTPEDESQPGYASVYLRKVFNVSDLDTVDNLVLRVDFDDSFVAYLNGTEVARAGLTGSPPRYNQTANTGHEAGSAVDYDITARKSLLNTGRNILAIQAHNVNLTSSDLSMIPELLSVEILPGPTIEVIGGIDELQKLVHVRGVYSRRQLQTVLAEFWENHFTTDFDKVAEYFDNLLSSDATDAMSEAQARAEAAQVEFEEYQFFYDNALGNFGDLLLYSATSPSMLIYLDNVLNFKREPNENYAREIFELSAFGVDRRYTQTDIEELAKCFTGWTVCKVAPEDVQGFPLSARNPPSDCGVQFEDSVLVDLGPGWKYFKGTEEPTPGPGGDPTTAWTEADYDDTAWLNGSTGIGYGDGDDATVLGDMRGNYLSVYLRKNFTLADFGVADVFNDIENLVMEINYDDGFVAYLNGHEIARSESMKDEGNPPAFDDNSELHEVDEGAEYYNLNGQLGFLDPTGNNVLAFQVHNGSLNSSDLSMRPRLFNRRILPGSVENGDPNAFWTFRFDPDEHHLGAKTLFDGTPWEINIPAGRSGIAGLNDALEVIDAMVNHPSTKEFICIKLIQKLVSDQLTLESFKDGSAPVELRALLADAIAAWESTDPPGNIETVMRTILDPESQSSAFWSELAYGSKVKTSIEFINSTLRSLEGLSDNGDDLPEINDNMGMHLFTRDEPDGYSELGTNWIDTGTMLVRMKFAQALAKNTDNDYGWNTLSFLDSRGLDTPAEIVDFFNDLLFQGTMPGANEDLLQSYLTTDESGNPLPFSRSRGDFKPRVEELIGLMLSMPQWNFQ